MHRLHQDEAKRMNSCSTSTRSLEPEPVGCSPKRLRPKCRNMSKVPRRAR